MEEVKIARKPREQKPKQMRDLKNLPIEKLPDLMNIYEVADYLMTDHNCLRRWIHHGKLPVMELTGGKKFIRKVDLIAFMNKSMVTYTKIEKTPESPSA